MKKNAYKITIEVGRRLVRIVVWGDQIRYEEDPPDDNQDEEEVISATHLKEARVCVSRVRMSRR